MGEKKELITLSRLAAIRNKAFFTRAHAYVSALDALACKTKNKNVSLHEHFSRNREE